MLQLGYYDQISTLQEDILFESFPFGDLIIVKGQKLVAVALTKNFDVTCFGKWVQTARNGQCLHHRHVRIELEATGFLDLSDNIDEHTVDLDHDDAQIDVRRIAAKLLAQVGAQLAHCFTGRRNRTQ